MIAHNDRFGCDICAYTVMRAGRYMGGPPQYQGEGPSILSFAVNILIGLDCGWSDARLKQEAGTRGFLNGKSKKKGEKNVQHCCFLIDLSFTGQSGAKAGNWHASGNSS